MSAVPTLAFEHWRRRARRACAGAAVGASWLMCAAAVGASCTSTTGDPLVELDRYVLSAGPGLEEPDRADPGAGFAARVASADLRHGPSHPNSFRHAIFQSVVETYEELVRLIGRGARVEDAPEGSVLAALNSGELLELLRKDQLLKALMEGWVGAFSFDGLQKRRTLQGEIRVDSTAGLLNVATAQGESVGEGSKGEVVGGIYRPHLEMRVEYRHHIPLTKPSQLLVVLSNSEGITPHARIRVVLQLPRYLRVVKVAAGVTSSVLVFRTSEEPTVRIEKDAETAGRWTLHCPENWELASGKHLFLSVMVQPNVTEPGAKPAPGGGS